MDDIAYLARLWLTDEEKAEFEKDLAEIVTFAHELGDSGIESPFLPARTTAELRSDTVADGLTCGEIEKLAPKSEKGMIVVPRVVS